MIGEGIIGPTTFLFAFLLAWAAIRNIRETGKVHPASVILLLVAFVLFGYLFMGMAAF